MGRERRRAESLNEEFLREWGPRLGELAGVKPALSNLLESVRKAIADAAGRKPLVWFFRLAGGGAADGVDPLAWLADYPVGVLALHPHPAPDDCYEVTFWVRGAYRSLGLGRQALEYQRPAKPGQQSPRLIEVIRDELGARAKGPVRLIARYPETGCSGADKLQRALWMSFFHDYDFRRRRSEGRREQVLTLERWVPGADPDEGNQGKKHQGKGKK